MVPSVSDAGTLPTTPVTPSHPTPMSATGEPFFFPPPSPSTSTSSQPQTIDPASLPSTRPSSPHSQGEKVYLKNKNGRTRKGVCLWFLSPWTGFENPFLREGFGDIGFLTDGQEVPAGETRLKKEDFEFRWAGNGDRQFPLPLPANTPAISSGSNASGSGSASASAAMGPPSQQEKVAQPSKSSFPPSSMPPTPIEEVQASFFAAAAAAAPSPSRVTSYSSIPGTGMIQPTLISGPTVTVPGATPVPLGKPRPKKSVSATATTPSVGISKKTKKASDATSGGKKIPSPLVLPTTPAVASASTASTSAPTSVPASNIEAPLPVSALPAAPPPPPAEKKVKKLSGAAAASARKKQARLAAAAAAAAAASAAAAALASTSSTQQPASSADADAVTSTVDIDIDAVLSTELDLGSKQQNQRREARASAGIYSSDIEPEEPSSPVMPSSPAMSSDSDASTSSDEDSDTDASDADAEGDDEMRSSLVLARLNGGGHYDDDKMSEAGTTFGEDDDTPFTLGWDEDEVDGDHDADGEDDEDDEDVHSTFLLTPRGSIPDGVTVMTPSAVASNAAAWSEFASASVAMSAELSVGLNAVSNNNKRAAIARRRGDSISASTPRTLFLTIPTHPHHFTPRHQHAELASPFTPLNVSSRHPHAHIHDEDPHSPLPASSVLAAHQEVFDELMGMSLNVREMDMDIDMDLASQNGDARRAGEDDLLIDELLFDEGGSLHEFEDAWANEKDLANKAKAKQLSRTKYLASPEPSGSEDPVPSMSATRARSYSLSRMHSQLQPAPFSFGKPLASASSTSSTSRPVRKIGHRRQLSHQQQLTFARQAQRDATGLSSPVSTVSSLPSQDTIQERSETPSSSAPSSMPAGTPARMYCPGMSVPMPQPESRAMTPTTDAEGAAELPRTMSLPQIVVNQQMPSTPPRTPSPSGAPIRSHSMMSLSYSSFSEPSSDAPSPQAELDALIVPGAPVSESPLPTALLLPTEGESHIGSEEQPQRQEPQPQPQQPVQQLQPQQQQLPQQPHQRVQPPLGHHQLGQIIVPTIHPSNPPICATFVDGVFVYTLNDPSSGHRLLRAVDSDYVHLSSLIAISKPPLSPSDALRIISLCQRPTIIPPTFSQGTSTVTPLAGSWVPLDEAHQLCNSGELNIPVHLGEVFLHRNLGETYFPDPIPEWCRSRKQLREQQQMQSSMMNPAFGGIVGAGMVANGLNSVGNSNNVSAMTALAELARMGGAGAPRVVPSPPAAPIAPIVTQPTVPSPVITTPIPSPVIPHGFQQQQAFMPQSQPQQDAQFIHHVPQVPSAGLNMNADYYNPAMKSRIVPSPVLRTASTASVFSFNSAPSSPPLSPTSSLSSSPSGTRHYMGQFTFDTHSLSAPSLGGEPPKKRGPGRPRKHPLAEDGSVPPRKRAKITPAASVLPSSTRSERAAARGSTRLPSLGSIGPAAVGATTM
ncbi:hypothetical protein DL93DRAFT_2085557 [Clavulina sp. PMI_390]|nr:hypothetical protein DL93DRAFT_2085557 [Clavulina sp. PMI_390]